MLLKLKQGLMPAASFAHHASRRAVVPATQCQKLAGSLLKLRVQIVWLVLGPAPGVAC